MHRWLGALIGGGAGVTVSANWGNDIATLVLFMVRLFLGHPLEPEVAAALTRITSGTVTAVAMVIANLLVSRLGGSPKEPPQ